MWNYREDNKKQYFLVAVTFFTWLIIDALNPNPVTTNTVLSFITLCSLTFSPGNILSPSYEKIFIFPFEFY